MYIFLACLLFAEQFTLFFFFKAIVSIIVWAGPLGGEEVAWNPPETPFTLRHSDQSAALSMWLLQFREEKEEEEKKKHHPG